MRQTPFLRLWSQLAVSPAKADITLCALGEITTPVVKEMVTGLEIRLLHSYRRYRYHHCHRRSSYSYPNRLRLQQRRCDRLRRHIRSQRAPYSSPGQTAVAMSVSPLLLVLLAEARGGPHGGGEARERCDLK